MRLSKPLLYVALMLIASACRSAGPRDYQSGPYRPVDDRMRSTVDAERLSRAAVDMAPSNPERAEELLGEALTADIFYGPAHNNLGVLMLGQDRLYEAANEFEWARKLMPANPEPRLNLGLTLERAGHGDDAMGAYVTALEISPEHIASQQALASLLLRSDRPHDKLTEMLHAISLQGETAQWREWAREQLVRRGD